MTAGTTTDPATEDLVRRVALAVLTRAVRGRRERGGAWGEAVLSEFPQTRGRWAALRWAAGGIRVTVRERRARGARRPRRVILAAIVAALAALAVQQWAVSPMYQPSGAMEPTLRIGDHWLMDRVSFHVTGLRYGDVIGLRYTADDGQRMTITRRVLGLPGDHMSCQGGRLLRNGSPVAEPYLRSDPEASTSGCADLVVPDRTVFVMGDHRSVAAPLGPVPVRDVEGRLLLRL